MSLTLLEKQGTIQYPRSGALINYHALGRQSGRLYGCNLVQATSETIVLTSGVLAVRGYRIEVVNETVFDSTHVVTPSTPIRYYIILKLDSGIEDTEMELIVTDDAPLNDVAIEEQTGIYDYVMGVFNFGPGGISEFTSLIETIKDRIPSLAEADGVRWFDGIIVDGVDPPIICDKEALPNVDIGDYYLNNTNGYYYKCIDVGEQYAYWEYKGSMRGPQGNQGPSPNLDVFYTKEETYSRNEVDSAINNAIASALGGNY